jgi:hypothetical protein
MSSYTVQYAASEIIKTAFGGLQTLFAPPSLSLACAPHLTRAAVYIYLHASPLLVGAEPFCDKPSAAVSLVFSFVSCIQITRILKLLFHGVFGLPGNKSTLPLFYFVPALDYV